MKGYTLDAAYAEFEENAKGSIKAGKLADLTVISSDITKLASKEILTIRGLQTFVGGRVVFSQN